MATYTPPVLHATADVLAVTDWNGVANDISYLAAKPYCNYYNSVTTSLPNSTNTQITLGGTINTAYGFSVISNDIVVPLTGAYWVVGSVYVSSGLSSGYLQTQVNHSGSSVLNSLIPASSTGLAVANCSGVVICNASDNLELLATQTSGSTLTTSATPGLTFLSAFYIGSL